MKNTIYHCWKKLYIYIYIYKRRLQKERCKYNCVEFDIPMRVYMRKFVRACVCVCAVTCQKFWMKKIRVFWFSHCESFNVKAIFLKGVLWYYLTHTKTDKESHTFPKGITPKVKVTAWLKLKIIPWAKVKVIAWYTDWRRYRTR